ncbi:MAG TPA: DUF58 domain-containing protein [bacterium]|nr:DUF58 domain-containing protein [bacterium]HOM27170.1 DUF58 domain-containing protein [bacterium]
MKVAGYLDPKVLIKFSSLNLVAKKSVEGFLSGLHKSIYKGFSVEFFEHREYAPGDDIRYIDWKVFGRTDKLFLKTYKEETNVRCFILLDTSNSMAYKTGEISKIQYGVYLSACLSYLILNQKDAVGFVNFNNEIKNFLKASSSFSHFHNIIEILEKIKPEGQTSILSVMKKISSSIKKRSIIILISDLFDNPQDVIKGIAYFTHHHHEVIVFQILDHGEISLKGEGILEFFDIETEEKISVDNEFIKKKYKENIEKLINFYKKRFTEMKIDYKTAITTKPFDSFLYEYLKLRMRKK